MSVRRSLFHLKTLRLAANRCPLEWSWNVRFRYSLRTVGVGSRRKKKKEKKQLQHHASATRKETNTVFNQGPHGCLATAETNLAAVGMLVLRKCLKPV